MNNSETQLLGNKPADAIKLRRVSQKPSLPTMRPGGLEEEKLPSDVGVRYLYQPGELDGGRSRTTDPVWSLEVYRIGRSVVKPDDPIFYYLDTECVDVPARGFVREKLLLAPKAVLAIRRLSLSSSLVRTSANVNALAQAFHGFSKYTVVHELVEVLLEVTGRLFPELDVHLEVGLHPSALLES